MEFYFKSYAQSKLGSNLFLIKTENGNVSARNTLSEKGRCTSGWLRLLRREAYYKKLRLPSRKAHPSGCATGGNGWLTDRWGPPVGFISPTARETGQRRSSTPAMIPGARDHRFQRSAYRRAQGEEPQLMAAMGLEEELGVDQSIINGGGEPRP